MRFIKGVLKFGVIVCLAVLVGYLSVLDTVSAWWPGNEEVVWDSLAPPMEALLSCSGEYETVQVGSIDRNACVYGWANSDRLAVYQDGGGAGYGLSIAGYETYVPLDLCDGRWGCVYSPAADILFAVEDGQLVTYENIHEMVRYGYDIGERSEVYGGWEVLPNSLAISTNGQWATALTESGYILKLDVLNGEVSELAHGMYAGDVNDVFLTISNTGDNIVAVGSDTSVEFYQSGEGCLIDDFFGERQCDVSSFPLHLESAPFEAIYPKFYDDGARLAFYAVSGANGENRYVVMQSYGYVSNFDGVSYLALGDSFTSGEGESSDEYYLAGTNTDTERCHVSQRSYPFIIGEEWGAWNTKNIACSGATISDILGGDAYTGQGDRLAGLSQNEYEEAVNRAAERYVQGRLPQIYFVERQKPVVVTVSIGGNDVGFMGKLSTCLMPGDCDMATDPEEIAIVAKEITKLFDSLTELYGRLKAASPDTKIIAVGYPSIIDSGVDCSFSDGLGLTQTERLFINEAMKYLNVVIAKAAESSGVDFMDISDAFEGKKLCQEATLDAMNSLVFGDDIAPISGLSGLKIIGAESFHPTPYGHALVGSLIKTKYKYVSMESEDGYSNGYDVDDIYSSVIAEVGGDFWGDVDDVKNATIQQPDEIVASAKLNFAKINTITARSGVFAANTTLDLSLSGGEVLGRVNTRADGSVSSKMHPLDSMPVKEGIYTVYLSGESANGEDVRVYDVVEVVYDTNDNDDTGDIGEAGDVDGTDATDTIDATGDTEDADSVVVEEVYDDSDVEAVEDEEMAEEGDGKTVDVDVGAGADVTGGSGSDQSFVAIDGETESGGIVGSETSARSENVQADATGVAASSVGDSQVAIDGNLVTTETAEDTEDIIGSESIVQGGADAQADDSAVLGESVSADSDKTLYVSAWIVFIVSAIVVATVVLILWYINKYKQV